MSEGIASAANAAPWWKRGIVYQIYPRSFQDSNDDGAGDLPGIRRRLPYLADLGVDAVWISPIYPSPMADFGYDVADYCGIHPLFGTLEDFDALVGDAHALGMKVLLDFVPNHTSDQHPWFLESRSSSDNPKRDWYLWRDPKADGGLPNNWLGHFGGPAWDFDAKTGQYYYHAFLKEQPDLNWRHPGVRAAMLDTLRFWLRRGVDGFRVDVMWLVIKDAQFRDNPPNPNYRPGVGMGPRDVQLPVYNDDQPETHEVVKAMRAVLDEFDDRVLIGEIYLPFEKLVRYYGENLDEAQMPFNFNLIGLPWTLEKVFGAIRDYEAALPDGAWPNWVLGNHDRSRLVTRLGAARARVAATLLLTLRGTPTMYYGGELGMHDVPIPPEMVQDPYEKNVPGQGLGRDPERTPMQWTPEPGAGFTSAKPWLPIAEDWREVNAAVEAADPNSMLNYYRALIRLRRAEPALALGSLEGLRAESGVLSFERALNGERLFVALNFSGEPASVNLPGGGVIALDSGLIRAGEAVSRRVELAGNEALVVKLR